MEIKELSCSLNPSTFILFLSFSGNGHSLLSSLLDAHENIVISREQRIVQKLIKGEVSKEDAFKSIIKSSKSYTLRGRPHKGSNTSHLVPNQSNGTFTSLKALGDKNGWGTVATISNRESLNLLRNTLGIRLSFIHIYRNPFDVVAHTRKFYPRYSLQSTIDRVISKYKAVCYCLSLVPSISLSLEDLVNFPTRFLSYILNSLSLEYSEDYLTSCSSIIDSSKLKSKTNIKWDPFSIERLTNFCKSISYLKRYSYEA